MAQQEQHPLNENHPFHPLIVSWGATPKLVIAGELFYDTKSMFPKHNLGRDVERYCDEKDWFKCNKRFMLNARGIVALAFGKRLPNVREVVYSRVGLTHRPVSSLSRAPAPVSLDVPGARSASPFPNMDADDESISRPGSAFGMLELPLPGNLQVHLPNPNNGREIADEDGDDDLEVVLPTPSPRVHSYAPIPPVAPIQMPLSFPRHFSEFDAAIHPGYDAYEDPFHPDYVEEELTYLYPPYSQPAHNHFHPTPTSFVSVPSASNAFVAPVPVYANTNTSSSASLKRSREEFVSEGQYDEEPMYKMARTQFHPSY